MDPVVVIGGGLAGLAAAARLAKNGHRVELFERSSSLGGLWAPTELRPGGPGRSRAVRPVRRTLEEFDQVAVLANRHQRARPARPPPITATGSMAEG